MLTQVPLSVSILCVDPRRVGLLHEGIPIFRGAAGKDGDEGRVAGLMGINQHTRSSGRVR